MGIILVSRVHSTTGYVINSKLSPAATCNHRPSVLSHPLSQAIVVSVGSVGPLCASAVHLCDCKLYCNVGTRVPPSRGPCSGVA